MITVITGPPCSGKSTYARKNRYPGDLTIDFDKLCQALGAEVSHEQDHWLREVTAAAWAAAVSRALSEPGHRAWIIDARPTRERQVGYKAAGARVISLTAPPGELHRRAAADGRPPGDHARIDAFLAADAAKDPAPRARTRW